MNDQEFEDAAAIHALAGLLAGGKDFFNQVPPMRTGLNANEAGFAEKAWAYAKALSHRDGAAAVWPPSD